MKRGQRRTSEFTPFWRTKKIGTPIQEGGVCPICLGRGPPQPEFDYEDAIRLPSAEAVRQKYPRGRCEGCGWIHYASESHMIAGDY